MLYLTKNLYRQCCVVLLCCYHTVHLCPTLDISNFFRIVQHKHTPSITVSLRLQGVDIKYHQSASIVMTLTELVQRLRQR